MKKLWLLLLVQLTGVYAAFGHRHTGSYKDFPGTGLPKDTVIAMPLQGVKDSLGSTASLVPQSIDISSPLAPPATGTDDIIQGNLNNYMLSFIGNYYRDNTKHLQAIQSKSESSFNIIDNVFHKFGIPDEMKYLAVIESDLNSNAVSRVGAVGTWQFMAATARLMGLRVNRRHDDRRNLYKSTEAAAQYLSQLYGSLQDWLLVVAAYNCGLGGVLRAINASGSNNFWDLQKYLPAESRKHVLKFIATTYIMERFADFFGMDKSSLNGGDALTPDATAPLNAADAADTKVIDISGKYSIPVIAKYLSMDINDLNKLNPGFYKLTVGDAGHYRLRLPADKMDVFKTNMSNILNESVQVQKENSDLKQSL